MTAGFSGTYAINGLDLATRPTSARWIQRDEAGIDGNGHAIYAAVRDLELKWNLMSPYDWGIIISAYGSVQNTGTLTWDLPMYGSPALNFYKTYSGTIISEPEQGEYFQGYVTDVSLLVYNVRT